MNEDCTQRSIPRLSKSRYTSFLACPRLGYLRAYPARFGSLCSEDPARQSLFDTGTMVGELAREYYPGGLLITADHLHIPQAVRQTKEALAAGHNVLYEAAFEHQGILVRIDILRRLADGSFELTEVKSGTRVDPVKHVPDVAVQLFVAELAGLNVSRASLMHLDRDYLHQGGPDYPVHKLFVSEDVTQAARHHIATLLPVALRDIATWLRSDEPPFVNLRNSCRDCEYYVSYCRPRGPEFPVGELGPATQAIALLEAAGVTDLCELSPESIEYARLAGLLRVSNLGPRTVRMLEAIREGELRADPGAAETLRGLPLPLHFLDFESWNPALPVFPGTRPYEQVPFQWSDHRLSADDVWDHAAYLAEGPEDPRAGLAIALVRRFADEGAVLAYHAPFERDRLRDLACLLPRLEGPLLGIAARLVDLKTIVADHVYHPGFHGSFSLKAVLPSLVPGCGYDGLAIKDGGSAALAYQRLRLLSPGPERDQLRADMLAYCAQDTSGMVEIYTMLRELA